VGNARTHLRNQHLGLLTDNFHLHFTGLSINRNVVVNICLTEMWSYDHGNVGLMSGTSVPNYGLRALSSD
jgi:hypothetical protein